MNEEFAKAMEGLKDAVYKLCHVYDKHPELNEQVNVSHLTPMSIDEWYHELASFIETYKQDWMPLPRAGCFLTKVDGDILCRPMLKNGMMDMGDNAEINFSDDDGRSFVILRHPGNAPEQLYNEAYVLAHEGKDVDPNYEAFQADRR